MIAHWATTLESEGLMQQEKKYKYNNTLAEERINALEAGREARMNIILQAKGEGRWKMGEGWTRTSKGGLALRIARPEASLSFAFRVVCSLPKQAVIRTLITKHGPNRAPRFRRACGLCVPPRSQGTRADIDINPNKCRVSCGDVRVSHSLTPSCAILLVNFRVNQGNSTYHHVWGVERFGFSSDWLCFSRVVWLEYAGI